ncbi:MULTISPECIES: NAD kinase [Alkalihalophilus]|uniref:NAD kinase n=2 Tax=Alkalihalophilus pseudofirmus TaxID=79885 RepID=D3FV11_ALKPO|nr:MULTISPECIES: NAD kinase [Alkalihalophilus]ADC48437.1 inorganic polyphosphate/ATP-NAD kinase [Alkalihalophilus pseudofirmus OF4]MDV2885618.1 NAD kinase [Alkalihalophilus pseudofirmus]MEC2073773.1 NAD kinase [Alkalihalophilus marmarensis]MED1601066.1 NAD kinase [Alkalihalophilus marmarensis]OLS39470.1 NAD kinase [Alkalihalophilus pseudofirmus]
MKFTVTSRGDDLSNTLQQRIKRYLLDFGLVYDEETPEMVVTVGGDGTLLQAFHDYSERLEDTAFVGIHTGHLGFYADWVPDEVEKLVIHIAKTPYQIVEYPLLEVVIRHEGEGKSERHLALNECTVKSLEGSLVSNVQIKGDTFEVFRGDGLCISTPSGSTAYNKALGGAILHPSLASIQIAEMASINNRVYRTVGSPLVLPQHHTCLLKPLNNVDVQVTIDHYTLDHKRVKSIQCRVAEEKIRFARFRPFPFWKRVKDSFIGE